MSETLFDILNKLDITMHENISNGRNNLRARSKAEEDIQALFLSSLGQQSGSDMSDDELVQNLRKLYQWGISTGRKLQSGELKKVDDREWEMVSSRLDQFEQTFRNRYRREIISKLNPAHSIDRENERFEVLDMLDRCDLGIKS